LGLCDRDLQITAHIGKFLRIDPAIDHPVAIGTNALQGAHVVAGQDAVGDLSSWHFWCPASEAVDTAGPARLLCSCPPVGKEARKFFASNQGWPLIVDRP